MSTIDPFTLRSRFPQGFEKEGDLAAVENMNKNCTFRYKSSNSTSLTVRHFILVDSLQLYCSQADSEQLLGDEAIKELGDRT